MSLRSIRPTHFAVIAACTYFILSGFRAPRSIAANPPTVVAPPAFAATQPDYGRWQQIKKDMDESDVIALLGEPLAKPDYYDRNSDVLYSWEYGYLTPRSIVFPKPLLFRIRFHRGKVFVLEDPFNGIFSTDGRPTVAAPTWPADPPVYGHYPRTLDLRWYPASGIYPMRYEIEIGQLGLDRNREIRSNWDTTVIGSDIPYISFEFDSMGPGRWRVRAVNSTGIGEWSDYCEFEFGQ